MPKTIVETILNPKFQNEFNFKNLDEKVPLCEEIKRLEKEIMSQLDREHKKMFRDYAECWDKLHMQLNLDCFSAGIKFAEIHNPKNYETAKPEN